MATMEALHTMHGADGVPQELRRAALMLHALLPQDRQWLLERLSPERRAQLGALLAELAELGIPRDERLVRDALAIARPASPITAEASDAWATLACQSAGAISTLLEGEPAGLVARLLAMRTWPWADALMQSYDAARRRRVEDSACEAWPGGVAVDAWLVADLARRALEPRAASADFEGNRR